MAGPVPQRLSDVQFGNAMATFDGIPIYMLTRCEPSEELLAGTGRTASGKGRFDFVASKRTWRVETSFMPLAKVEPLYNHLVSISWAWGDWWCWRLGLPTSTVRARIEGWKETPMGRVPNLWSVSFNVIEQ